MRFKALRRLPRFCRLVVLGGAFPLLMGGCPVDTSKLVTDVVAAALQSASDSIVDALSAFLAQP